MLWPDVESSRTTKNAFAEFLLAEKKKPKPGGMGSLCRNHVKVIFEFILFVFSSQNVTKTRNRLR